MNAHSRSLLTSLVLQAALASTGLGQCELQRVQLASPAPSDNFGRQVAMAAGVAFVSAPWRNGVAADSGAVYVLAESANWGVVQTLTASDAGANRRFGNGGAQIDGQRAIIGGFGSAYIFEWTGSAWVETARLIGNDTMAGDDFGYPVRISGDVAAVGSAHSGFHGAAYVFRKNGSTWTQTQKLTAQDAVGHDEFGVALALTPEHLVVGAFNQDLGSDTRVGAAYLFTSTGGPYTQTQKLRASDASENAQFGAPLDIQGDVIAISARGARSAYIFNRTGTGWVEQQKVGLPSASAQFGCSLQLIGDRLLVGDYLWGVGGSYPGAVHQFRSSAGGFEFERVIQGRLGVDGGRFGLSISAFGDTLAVGAPSSGTPVDSFGSASVFSVPLALSGNTCASTPNSSGWPASLWLGGCPSVGANALSLRAGPVPANVPGIFWYSDTPVQLTFGDGFRCVGGVIARLPVTSASGTQLTWDLDLGQLPPSAPIGVGSTMYFQAWFRDPAAAGSGFNLSDAARVRFGR